MGPHILEDLTHKNGSGQTLKKVVNWVLGVYINMICFIFTPILGEDFQFEMGWFNHQPDMYSAPIHPWATCSSLPVFCRLSPPQIHKTSKGHRSLLR